MKKLMLLMLVALLTAGFFATPAHAQTVEECQALIDQTSSDLATITIGGNNPEQTLTGLQSKLDVASTKLEEGKYQDAIDKLVDFRTTVERLATAPKPKISQADADLLIADANAAIACIEELQAGG
jgi:FIMAH domain-containing protein